MVTKNKDKILVLGESFTFGWLLRDEDTFVHKLQKDNLNYNFIQCFCLIEFRHANAIFVER